MLIHVIKQCNATVTTVISSFHPLGYYEVEAAISEVGRVGKSTYLSEQKILSLSLDASSQGSVPECGTMAPSDTQRAELARDLRYHKKQGPHCLGHGRRLRPVSVPAHARIVLCT